MGAVATKVSPSSSEFISLKNSSILLKNREFSYLSRGTSQPGGKLPLFDLDGQAFEPSLIRRCVEKGWAEPWFTNPIKPDWLVCKLTAEGRAVIERALQD